MNYILTPLYIVFAYLLGSIPFSHFFPHKIRGKDVRKEGSGNVGATNVLVVAGPWPALLALLGDIAKGYLAIMGARLVGLTDWGIALAGLAAIAGHDFSAFLMFRGGKGVATTGGILLALDPLLTLVVVFFWLFSFLVVRYFIPATVLVICLLPAIFWLGSWGIEYIVFAIGAAGLALYAHRFDLQRYFSGKETTISEALKNLRNK
ncbi:MAG: glycerol-3-phosphate 1-O-acyltransferase PlsY [Candidatus Margulisbacteria bacterium]|nr:glycerol-3-phosphate 1-O-acyltransferase PlsY [Candidatus Margulisiibacteriota bacterium]MBU1617660.1 glycerol-3-phosphate 1-O-acyltransferase PlsY [Candidatus Margulisiibacteriota bacterium]MBU1867330.1 glycerol-3-phosphate 1-O-acyltransferase PlsY [Candidatus Margulisiibacteriota bacterium]